MLQKGRPRDILGNAILRSGGPCAKQDFLYDVCYGVTESEDVRHAGGDFTPRQNAVEVQMGPP